MKLSEILTYVNYFETGREEGNEYGLLFSKWKKPYIRLIELSDQTYDSLFDEYYKFKVTNPNFHVDYLYYYLSLNMKLLRPNEEEPYIGLEMDYLDVEFINNVDIPLRSDISGRYDIQKSTAEFLDDLVGKQGIDYYDAKIKELFKKNLEFLEIQVETVGNDYADCGNDLYKITNILLFIKNVRKGKFKNPIEEYIEILHPEVVIPRYLEYWWYYNEVLDNPDNYEFYVNNYYEFNGNDIFLSLPTLEEQQKIVDEMTPVHNKILELQEKKHKAKLFLRSSIELYANILV